jgi:hypothetical protein
VTGWLASTLQAVPLAPDLQQQQQQHLGSPRMLHEALLSPGGLSGAANSPGLADHEQQQALQIALAAEQLQEHAMLHQAAQAVRQQQQQKQSIDRLQQERQLGGAGVRELCFLDDSEHR